MNELFIGDTHLSLVGNQLQIRNAEKDKTIGTIPADELLILHNYIGTLLGAGAQRQAFRLHREALDGLSASISAKGKDYPVTVHDLSITGLHFQVKKELGLVLETSDSCTIAQIGRAHV